MVSFKDAPKDIRQSLGIEKGGPGSGRHAEGGNARGSTQARSDLKSARSELKGKKERAKEIKQDLNSARMAHPKLTGSAKTRNAEYMRGLENEHSQNQKEQASLQSQTSQYSRIASQQ